MSNIELTDLLCKARQGTLPSDEQRRLDQLLEISPEVRLMGAIQAELDRESVVQRGDEAIVARMAANTATRLARRSQRLHHHLRSSMAAALTLLLVSTVAGAWWTKRHGWRPQGAAAPIPTVVRRSDQQPVSMRKPNDDTPRLPVAVEAAEVAVRPMPTGSLAPSRAANEPTPSVSDLFATANLIRRDGNYERATQLYRRIVEVYPDTREATLARLALAKLVEGKNPRAALALYQAVAKSGVGLRAEALWGIAESARHLGQAEAEREALGVLLRDFPDSSYADVARKRLQDGNR
jgi:tetratricopeptide (TPR) repeat protein